MQGYTCIMAAALPLHRYMSTPVATVPAQATLIEAEERLRERKVSALAVVDDGRLVGVLTRTDLLRVSELVFTEPGARALHLIAPGDTVSTAMTTDVVTVGVEDSLALAAERMWERRIHRLFVCSGGEVRGVVSTRDVMRAMSEQELALPLSSIMSAPLLTVDAHEPALQVAARLAAEPVSGLVVMEGGHPVGIFAQDEALIAHHLGEEALVDWVMNPALFVLPAELPLFRAAQRAAAVDVRRILVRRDERVVGMVSGLDFCRHLAAS